MFRTRLHTKGCHRGFSLVELAIVLGVASILFAGLWRLMSAGNSQTRDQAAAEQHAALIGSVRDYLASSDGQSWMTAAASPASLSLPASGSGYGEAGCAAEKFCNFLSPGVNSSSTNAYGQSYDIRVTITKSLATGAVETYAFMVSTTGGDTIPDTSGGRIASLIGGDGGFRYSAAVCGAATNLCGAYGAWTIDPNTVYGTGVAAGHIGSNTYVSGGASANAWLARRLLPGNDIDGIPDYNTIQTNISLGGQTLWGRGSTGLIGGRIENLGYLSATSSSLSTPVLDLSGQDSVIEAVAANDKGNPVAKFNRGGCNAASTYPGDDPVNFTCDYTVIVNGGQSVTGMLSANRLYASQFLYNTISSDIRLKHEIKGIDNALEKVAKLRGYSFFLDKEKKRKYGVIAQDVQKYFPEIVNPIGKGYIGVDYMGLIGPIVAAVHDLKEENDALKAELKEIKEMLQKKK